MSRRLLFLLATGAVMVYFSLILFMLGPLHSAGAQSRNASLLWLVDGYRPLLGQSRLEWCKKLHFRDPPEREAVALASFPGSGNTWLRYLLQEATGILTGSIYMDYGLYKHGFPGENVTNGSVLVVKTHQTEPWPYKAAVLLIRNPRDAILAEFHRLHRGHVGTAPLSAFKVTQRTNKSERVVPDNGSGLEWADFVHTYIQWYEDLYRTYLQKFPGRVLVVAYETLVHDTQLTLSQVLDFLNVTVSPEDMKCAMALKEGIYRRHNKWKDFDPFTPLMYRELERASNRVLDAIEEYRSERRQILA